MTDAPVMQVIPVEDLDKVEKLLDVALSCVEMPHLSAIKNACMDELAQINASLEEAQGAALEAFNKEKAEYEAAERAKAKKEADAAKAKNGDYSKERAYSDSGIERRV